MRSAGSGFRTEFFLSPSSLRIVFDYYPDHVPVSCPCFPDYGIRIGLALILDAAMSR